MRARHLLPALFCAGLAASRADLDLTPQQMIIGGGLAQRTYFRDGAKRLAVSIDSDTEVSAEDGGAVFRFKQLPRATLRLTKSALKPSPTLTPELVQAYLKAANQLLPSSAERRVLTAQARDVFPINQWKSARFTFTYVMAGVSFTESVTFLSLDERQQIVLRIAAEEKDFEAAKLRADDIIRRWHEVLPGDEEGAN
jgi:hypothetical protein